MFKIKTFENEVIQFLMARRFLGKDLYFFSMLLCGWCFNRQWKPSFAPIVV